MTIRRAVFFILLLTLLAGTAQAMAPAPPVSVGRAPDVVTEEELQGAWRYRSIAARGETRPVTGLIVFHEGSFLQVAFHDGMPRDAQTAFANAGAYRLHDAGVQLALDMEMVVEPTSPAPSRYREGSSQDCRLSVAGNRLTLTFPSEESHELERVPLNAPPIVSGSYRITRREQASQDQTPTGLWLFSADRVAYIGAVKAGGEKPSLLFAGEGSFLPVEGSETEVHLLLERTFESGNQATYGVDRAFQAQLARGDGTLEIRYDGGETWHLQFLR